MIPGYPTRIRNMTAGSSPADQMEPDKARQADYRMVAGSARSRIQSERQDDVRISARYALYDDKTGNHPPIPKTWRG